MYSRDSGPLCFSKLKIIENNCNFANGNICRKFLSFYVFHLARLVEKKLRRKILSVPGAESFGPPSRGRLRERECGGREGRESSVEFVLVINFQGRVLAGTMSNTQGVLCLPTLLLAQQARVPKSVSAAGVYSRTLTSPLFRALEFGIGNTSPRVPLYVQENLTASVDTASTSQRSDTVS